MWRLLELQPASPHLWSMRPWPDSHSSHAFIVASGGKQIEDLLTTYFVAYETIGAAPSAIVPFLTEAMSALHCRTAATVGEIHNPWKAYCQRNSTIPQLVKREFLSIDCASEICAIMKHQTPLPPATVL